MVLPQSPQRILHRNEKLLQSFNELGLSPLILRAVHELGYKTPSPIQAQALPILLGEPTDFLGLAATGTGKTAAFGIPLLEKIDLKKRAVQALILCPTRELALQVAGQINLLGKHKGVRALPIYGGSGYGEQLAGLKQGIPVVVGTPGRMVEHIERGRLCLDNLQTVVLDEADEMISMGFKDELETILKNVPEDSSNIWLFSATMGREVRKVADEYLRDPKQVQVNRTEMLAEGVEQLYYVTQESNKPEILCKLIEGADDFYGLIFCQTKHLVNDLTQYLINQGYRADCLHGDMDQSARERTMQGFRDRNVNLLVCTDVASRGLDVKDITHVVNYSIPRELDNYVHRIGRTARSGKTGYAMSLVTPSNRSLIPRIERMTKRRMSEGRVPSRKEIASRKVAKALEHFHAQDAKTLERAKDLLSQPWRDALEKMGSDEVAGRFLAMMFQELLAQREKPAVIKQGR
ncbi:DEAD/DEAH box helicase [Bdellovibrionota bacterium FG-1]